MKLNYTNCFSIIDNNQKANVDQGKIGSQDDYNIITHAHSDHVSISNQKTFTTKETSALIGLQTSRELNYSFLNCAPQDLTDNIKVQALNAGHILGSKMFYFESKDNTVLYTGDFRARDSLLFLGHSKTSRCINMKLPLVEKNLIFLMLKKPTLILLNC